MKLTTKKGKDRFPTLSRLGEFNLDYWILRGLLVSVVLALVLLSWWLGESRRGYRLGEPSPRTYVAIMNTNYLDEESTGLLRRHAADNIVAVMTKDSHAEMRIRDRLEQLKRRNGTEGFSVTLREMLSAMTPARRIRMLHLAQELGLSILQEKNWGKDIQQSLWDGIMRLPIPRPEQNAVFQILEEIFQEPVKIDDEATEKLKRETASKVEPVVRVLYPGDLIVERGEVVTPQKVRLLEAQGYPKGDLPYRSLFFILLAVFSWSLWPSLYATRREVTISHRDLVYIVCLLSGGWTIQVASSLLKADTLAFLPLLGWLNLTLPVGLAFHIALGGVVIGAMLSSSGSMAQLVLWSLSGITASIAGYLVFRGSSTRIDLWKQQCIMGLSAAVPATAIRWWLGLPVDGQVVGIYLLAVVAWGTFTVAVLPMLDTMFDILSPLRLMDLSHPSNPLLKRLQMEAPGTYHHTLMVGTLSERAADTLGLDSLLVKAGAYFHDIGKLKRPQFFAENQASGENLHDELNPSMSALVILSHVKDGLELARRYNLPTRIRHFISEHHGTTCLTYFYRKSKARGEDTTRDQFSYPGPKPSSKETALVMLADSVEAAVRAAGGNIRGVLELRETVEGVVESKMLDGQLERVDFTLKDLTLIKESFIQSLRSIYHKRDTTGAKAVPGGAEFEGGSETDEISGSD
jgi:putative nucleotidyltransferase with HDIG domain